MALILSRQKLPVIDRNRYSAADGLSRGAYVVADCDGTPDILLIATGSEVHITLEAKECLAQKGVSARVVSMPSWELFEKTPKEYQEKVLPPDVTTRIAVEAGHPMGWERYSPVVVGIDGYGASAPGNIVMEKFGFTSDNIVGKALELLKK